MNANKKIFKILVLCLLVLIPINIKGYTVTQGNASYLNGTLYCYNKYIGDTLVFCTQFERNAPSYCNSTTSLSKRVKAGIGVIVKWYNDNKSTTNYICAEKLLTKFMYNYVNTSGREDYNLNGGYTWITTCGTTTVQNTYAAAETAYNIVDDLNTDVITYKKDKKEVSKLTFEESGDYYVATVNVRTPGDKYKIECDVNEGKVEITKIKNDKNDKYYQATVRINKSKSKENTTLKCKAKYTFNAPDVYYSGCNGQNLISSSLSSVTKEGSWEKISGTTPSPSKGSLLIKKKNSDTGEEISGAGFILYSGKGCTGTVVKKEQKTNTLGQISITDLDPGNYSIYESTVPTGYITPSVRCTNLSIKSGETTEKEITNTKITGLKVIKTDMENDVLATLDNRTTPRFRLYKDSNCTDGTHIKDFAANEIVSGLRGGVYYLKEYQTKQGYHLPSSGEQWYCTAITLTSGQITEITVQNKTECEYQFRNGMSMKERIDLYNTIKSNYGLEFNGLLDSNNTTAATACKNIPIKKSYDKSCFGAASSSTNSSTFSGDNVSMYTEKYGSYTFCLTTYNLTNNLGTSKFSNIKSGQAIINTDSAVATASLNRICYNFGDTSIDATDYTNFKYSNYVQTEPYITVETDEGNKNVSLIRSETSSGMQNNKTITVTYTLPHVYSSNKDGRLYYSNSYIDNNAEGYCPNGQYCNYKYIGKAIMSNFNLQPNTYNLNFNLVLNTAKFGKLNNDSDCTYSIINELIVYNDELELEFRTIDTSNPFPGKLGNIRTTGSNWCSTSSCNGKSNRNSTISTYITNANNSYNATGEGAKYEIELTPSSIKEIRNYNKNKEYDDYNFICKNDGKICISNYLTDLKNKGLITKMVNEKRSSFED